ncbi:MAG: hypothetical protein M3P85_08910 [Actinomycetota bacterium]|nr:hypothetical protein [Actinomycetota bacterium]
MVDVLERGTKREATPEGPEPRPQGLKQDASRNAVGRCAGRQRGVGTVGVGLAGRPYPVDERVEVGRGERWLATPTLEGGCCIGLLATTAQVRSRASNTERLTARLLGETGRDTATVRDATHASAHAATHVSGLTRGFSAGRSRT